VISVLVDHSLIERELGRKGAGGPPVVTAAERGADGPASHNARADTDRLDPSVRRQLQAELDSALAFADYCRFLGREHVRSCAEELVNIAQRLYEETLSSVPRIEPY
jgi:hypothetical protein